MRKLALLSVAFALVAVSFCGCGPQGDLTEPEQETALFSSSAVADCTYDPARVVVRGNTLHGTDGDDEIVCLNAAHGVKIYGYGGQDVLVGSQFDDYIEGGDGCDRILGLDGDDTILGGEGDDGPEGCLGVSNYGCSPPNPEFCRHGELSGGAGDDLVDGGKGNDRVRGDDGNDLVLGGPGNDYVRGGIGDDELDGGPGCDFLLSGEGSNLFLGGPGNDSPPEYGGCTVVEWAVFDGGVWVLGMRDGMIRGGYGDDVLEGGAGDDYLWGHMGDDQLEGGPGWDVCRDCGDKVECEERTPLCR